MWCSLLRVVLLVIVVMSRPHLISVRALNRFSNSVIFSKRLHSRVWTSPGSTLSFRSKELKLSLIPTQRLFCQPQLRHFSAKGRKKAIPELREYFKCVQSGDFDKSKELFDKIMATYDVNSGDFYPPKNILTAMLSLCKKGSQLDFAFRLRNDLVKAGYCPSESDIFPIINCACDKGDIDLAKMYLNEIISSSLIVRHRDTFRILQAVVESSASTSTNAALDECFLFEDYNIYPRPQEVELIVASAVKTGAYKSTTFRDKFVKLLSRVSDVYCAIGKESALRMHQAVSHSVLACEERQYTEFLIEAFKKGILVERKSDISGNVSGMRLNVNSSNYLS